MVSHRTPAPADANDVRAALVRGGLMANYRQRPPYQQNDYLGWMARAKRPETRQKLLDQMLDEQEKGGVNLNMKLETLVEDCRIVHFRKIWL